MVADNISEQIDGKIIVQCNFNQLTSFCNGNMHLAQSLKVLLNSCNLSRVKRAYASFLHMIMGIECNESQIEIRKNSKK